MHVLIADDHPVVRMGVRNVLRRISGIMDVEEAGTSEEALRSIETGWPDIVVLNTTLVDAHSIDVLHQIKRLQPDLPIIVLHPEPDSAYADLALLNGASGIMTKMDDAEILVEAIEIVMGGDIYLSPDIKAQMDSRGHA